MLAIPSVVSTKWLAPLKGFTAYQANRILGRTGTPFWQDESYDHVVKSDAGLERVRRYIENNPVRAGLSATAGYFRWSSAARNGRAA